MIQAVRDKDQPDIPDDFGNHDYSPYRFFTAEEWAHFRADTPLTLTADEVQRLRSLNDPVDLDEVLDARGRCHAGRDEPPEPEDEERQTDGEESDHRVSACS